MKRYYRYEEDGAIYDRESMKTIEPVVERLVHDHYEVRDGWGDNHYIYRDDIEEVR